MTVAPLHLLLVYPLNRKQLANNGSPGISVQRGALVFSRSISFQAARRDGDKIQADSSQAKLTEDEVEDVLQITTMNAKVLADA